MKLQQEIDEFHKKIRARALLIAVEWAGSADKLAKMIGLERSAARKWMKCGRIPPLSALALSRISGFPLGFAEMEPADSVRPLRTRFRCPHCTKDINPPDTRTGFAPLLRACSEETARKRADKPTKAYKPNRKQRAAKANGSPSLQHDVKKPIESTT